MVSSRGTLVGPCPYDPSKVPVEKRAVLEFGIVCHDLIGIACLPSAADVRELRAPRFEVLVNFVQRWICRRLLRECRGRPRAEEEPGQQRHKNGVLHDFRPQRERIHLEQSIAVGFYPRPAGRQGPQQKTGGLNLATQAAGRVFQTRHLLRRSEGAGKLAACPTTTSRHPSNRRRERCTTERGSRPSPAPACKPLAGSSV